MISSLCGGCLLDVHFMYIVELELVQVECHQRRPSTKECILNLAPQAGVRKRKIPIMHPGRLSGLVPKQRQSMNQRRLQSSIFAIMFGAILFCFFISSRKRIVVLSTYAKKNQKKWKTRSLMWPAVQSVAKTASSPTTASHFSGLTTKTLGSNRYINRLQWREGVDGRHRQ